MAFLAGRNNGYHCGFLNASEVERARSLVIAVCGRGRVEPELFVGKRREHLALVLVAPERRKTV